MELDINDIKTYLLSNGWTNVIVGRSVRWRHPFTTKTLIITDALSLTKMWCNIGASFDALPEAD